jgi:endonuclease/exonuclease/phosphatase family metal-dependent hydrolase
MTINALRKNKIAITAIQETRWNKSTPQAFASGGYNVYTSSLTTRHEFGTAFLVDSKYNHLVINFTPINERLCTLRIKGRFFNYSLINIHAPTNDSEEEAKDQFYEQLERAYSACPKNDVKLVMGDANAKVGRETNENGLRLIDFAAGRQMAIKSTYFMHKRIHLETWHSPDGRTCNQIDHCLIDGRHFSDVIDVRARRGANIDSDHMLVVIRVRFRISLASNMKPQQLKRFAVDRLIDAGVATRYHDELETELCRRSAMEPEPLSLDDIWKRTETAVREVAEKTIGYTRKQARNEWFDEECARVNEKKNAARARALGVKTRNAKNAYKQARAEERNLFRRKSRQLDEEALIEIERHRSIQDTRKFYKRLNDVRRPFEAQVAMCRAKNGDLLTNKDQVLSRWKEHFEQHLNEGAVAGEGAEQDQPPDLVDLRDDGVEIDLPSREEIEGALKYLKNNKAAGADSIAAELLKSGGPNLVDALHEVIQLAWIGETIPEGWTKGVLCPVYKKGDKLDCANYRGICLLNVAYKVFAKVLYDRLLPYANAVVQHYQAGFQSGKSTTDQLFALRQILEKGNEYNIQTHHLFIDFKAAYDTIIRNEVYVSMSELNFPTKLIRLTMATLRTVLCCVKIQNDCSEYFETRQGLRQGDVLSTLLFNVVLEVIVRRANMQTSGTIFNKQTQLLAYADDIDIIGRSQAAVREAFLALEREANKVGLKINESKTKYMIAAGNSRTVRDVGQSVAFGDKTFEVVNEFVYLGSLVTPNNDVSLEIKRRIQTANRCFSGLRKQLQSGHLSRPTKFIIYKTLIRPVLLYGSETWVLTRREENQLLVFERKVLRSICGPKVENGVFRRRYNFELEREFNSPCVVNVVKTNRLRYAGHMIRRPEDLPQKAIFIARPQGTRRQGRPRSRWADGVISDSRALGAQDWTNRARDRVIWRELLRQALTNNWL